jgi:hypothetical protein
VRKIKPRSFEEVARVAAAHTKTVAVQGAEEAVVTRAAANITSSGSSCLVGATVVTDSRGHRIW